VVPRCTPGLQGFLYGVFSRARFRTGEYPCQRGFCSCEQPPELSRPDALRGVFEEVRKVISKLKAGRGVCLFPEGTRTRDGRIGVIKPGFGLLCRRGKAGVMPVVIDGAFECWPRHKKIFSPGSISVCYGEAITAEQAKEIGDEKLAEVLTETLRQMQNDLRAKHGKEPYSY